MKSKHILAIIAAGLIVASSALPVLGFDQPNMQSAKANLINAQKSLRKATADKGGHRQKALDLVGQAVIAVNKGMQYDRTHRTSNLGDESFLPLSTGFDQPNMENARSFLQNALQDLNRATADKGGFRQQAISLVTKAIEEVNAGIEYDRRH